MEGIIGGVNVAQVLHSYFHEPKDNLPTLNMNMNTRPTWRDRYERMARGLFWVRVGGCTICQIEKDGSYWKESQTNLTTYRVKPNSQSAMSMAAVTTDDYILSQAPVMTDAIEFYAKDFENAIAPLTAWLQKICGIRPHVLVKGREAMTMCDFGLRDGCSQQVPWFKLKIKPLSDYPSEYTEAYDLRMLNMAYCTASREMHYDVGGLKDIEERKIGLSGLKNPEQTKLWIRKLTPLDYRLRPEWFTALTGCSLPRQTQAAADQVENPFRLLDI